MDWWQIKGKAWINACASPPGRQTLRPQDTRGHLIVAEYETYVNYILWPSRSTHLNQTEHRRLWSNMLCSALHHHNQFVFSSTAIETKQFCLHLTTVTHLLWIFPLKCHPSMNAFNASKVYSNVDFGSIPKLPPFLSLGMHRVNFFFPNRDSHSCTQMIRCNTSDLFYQS